MPGKAPANIRSLARQHDQKALAKLVKLIDSDDEKVAMAASIAILDRGHGKPTTPVEVSMQTHEEALGELE